MVHLNRGVSFFNFIHIRSSLSYMHFFVKQHVIKMFSLWAREKEGSSRSKNKLMFFYEWLSECFCTLGLWPEYKCKLLHNE